MRLARVRGEGGGAFYHCMSRVVEGRFIFNTMEPAADGALEAAAFVGLMRKLERFHGLRIVTYALMSNHFHLLVREPLERLGQIGDEELVAKVGELNGSAAGQELRWRLRHYQLHAPEAAEALKATYLERMGDVSAFLKELKGRFAQWYNRRHGRYGVLWAERFKSVLVEGSREALLTVAAYIDLNAVRAGLVSDPAEYRYCGYGESVGGGSREARRGLRLALCGEGDTWRELQAAYRMLLYTAGEEVLDEDGRVARLGMSLERAESVVASGGRVGVARMLRLRVRYFGAGLVLGSREFVERAFERHREHFGIKRRDGAREMRGFGQLRVMRDLRLDVIG